MLRDEQQRMHRVQGVEDFRIHGDAVDPRRRDGQKPRHTDRPEQPADDGDALALKHEQPDDDADGDRHHHRLQGRGADFKTLDGRQHRNGRRQNRFTDEQRCAEEPCHHQRRPVTRLPPHRSLGQRQQRHDAALTVVVRPHDQDDVLQRHHDHQCPEDGGNTAQHVFRRDGDAMRGIERLLDCIQGTGSDIAVDNPQCQKGQSEF